MKFSIRAMLATTFIVALGLLLWRSESKLQQAKASRDSLDANLRALKLMLQMDNPSTYQTNVHRSDEFASMGRLKRQALDRIAFLQEKYGTIVSQGPGVFSIRQLPWVSREGNGFAIVFKMLVPESRDVWLKFAVREVATADNSSSVHDETERVSSDTPFTQSGPFEIKLAIGEHQLRIETQPAPGGNPSIALVMDERIILQGEYATTGQSSGGSTHLNLPRQFDVPPTSRLPWLWTYAYRGIDAQDGQEAKKHVCSIWFSDESSQFEEFPSE